MIASQSPPASTAMLRRRSPMMKMLLKALVPVLGIILMWIAVGTSWNVVDVDAMHLSEEQRRRHSKASVDAPSKERYGNNGSSSSQLTFLQRNLHTCPVAASRSILRGLPTPTVDATLIAVEKIGKQMRTGAHGVANISDNHNLKELLLSSVCDLRFDGNPGKVTKLDWDRAASLHWLRRFGVLSAVFGCDAWETQNAPRPSVELAAAVPYLTWKQAVPALSPLLFAATSSGSRLPPHNESFTQFLRAPKTASWVVGHNIAATCVQQPRAFYMNPKHSCFLSLWGFGTPFTLKKLLSTSRHGRNAIFKEREASFQVGGILPVSHFQQQCNGRFIPGTTFWLGALEVDNVGHVIHDALWAWQLVLMLPELFPTDTSFSKRPRQAVFAHDFERISSDYFGTLSYIIAKMELERDGSILDAMRKSPFPLDSTNSPQRDNLPPLVCFERLVIPGQDRHVDGGGLGLRSVVATRLRKNVFRGLDLHHGEDVHTTRIPHVYVYGRNDVHRRSIDNTHALYATALDVTQQLDLPHPIQIDTFTRPVGEQIAMMSQVDILLAIQGSHMQNSLFMPRDGVIIEIAPCKAERVSFIQRYGKYLDEQSYTYLPLCDGVVVNYSDLDPTSQNVTLCPHMLVRIREVLHQQALALMNKRRA